MASCHVTIQERSLAYFPETVGCGALNWVGGLLAHITNRRLRPKTQAHCSGHRSRLGGIVDGTAQPARIDVKDRLSGIRGYSSRSRSRSRSSHYRNHVSNIVRIKSEEEYMLEVVSGFTLLAHTLGP